MQEESLYEKLKTELQTVEFDALKPHVDRDALIVCRPKLDIIQIAIDLAQDNVEKIKALMASGDLKKVTKEEAEEIPMDRKYVFIIIQPFVLVQAIH
ncbi:MAG: DUF2288 family protein [Bdellovibrionota bacterium]